MTQVVNLLVFYLIVIIWYILNLKNDNLSKNRFNLLLVSSKKTH